jgi:hypothetical protein
MFPSFSPAVAPLVNILLAGLPVPAPMKVVCAWCTTVIRDGVAPISHGICAPCVVRVEAAL